MGLKKTFENHPVIWILGLIVTSFASGYGTYELILKNSGAQVVPRTQQVVAANEIAIPISEYEKLKNECSKKQLCWQLVTDNSTKAIEFGVCSEKNKKIEIICDEKNKGKIINIVKDMHEDGQRTTILKTDQGYNATVQNKNILTVYGGGGDITNRRISRDSKADLIYQCGECK